jgi:hypothetical protein
VLTELVNLWPAARIDELISLGMGRRPRRRRAGGVINLTTKPAFTNTELDEILRGTGRNGGVGMSAVDGLIAALVAAPSTPMNGCR